MAEWTYVLAPDVSVKADADNVVLQAGPSQFKLSARDASLLGDRLADSTGARVFGQSATPQASSADDTMRRAKALVHLDQAGLVAHVLGSTHGPVATCIPLRPPALPRPSEMSATHLRLAPQSVLRPRDGGLSLEMPGAWARISIHDARVLALLAPLAKGCPPLACHEAAPTFSKDCIDALLIAFEWCGLIEGGDTSTLAPHDMALHAATRQGYARTPLGKTGQAEPDQHDTAHQTLARFALDKPDEDALVRKDPSFAAVCGQRQSSRLHSAQPISSDQLSEFLFRTLHHREGRRPYPSGGACYPLTGYLALHRCLDMQPGLYRYDAVAHGLDMVAESSPTLNSLLGGAADAAGVPDYPQVLMILSARFSRSTGVYEGLSYSLILKEAGAIIQTAMLAAAAMGLASCPLGTGNALAFSDIAGLDPLSETSVGEFTLGTAPENSFATIGM